MKTFVLALSLLFLAPAALAAEDTHDRHVAIAVGLTTFNWNDGQAVNVAGAIDDNPDVARQTAIKRCHHANFPEFERTCQVVFEMDHGCQYFIKGTHPWGGAGYGNGPNPQAAYDDCRTHMTNCESKIAGGCTSPALKKKWPDLVLAPTAKTVYSLSVGLVRQTDGSGTLTVAGSPGLYAAQADNFAIASCKSAQPTSGTGFNCKVAYRFEHGCGYISDGWVRQDAHWAFGRTKDEAKANCDATGAYCDRDKIRGGCVEGE